MGALVYLWWPVPRRVLCGSFAGNAVRTVMFRLSATQRTGETNPQGTRFKL